MNIFTVNEELINNGRQAFSAGVRQYLGGPSLPFYEEDMGRDTGVAVVPGAIVAALEFGVRLDQEIIPMVSRVSRCRCSTVSTILEALSEETVPDRLWERDENGVCQLIRNDGRKPFSVIAA